MDSHSGDAGCHEATVYRVTFTTTAVTDDRESVAQFGDFLARHGISHPDLRVVPCGIVPTLLRDHRDREWFDRIRRRWRWSDINGWVVDSWATIGGNDPDGHGPFTEAV